MTSEREPRILIVDDRREVARVLRTTLELQNKGYRITDVPSGEEAMLEIQRVQFDLMVTDLRLPGISGPELIRRAAKRSPGMQFMVISGHTVSEVHRELGDLQVVGVFEKPLDTSAFAAEVNLVLLGETEVEESFVAQAEGGFAAEIDLDAVSRVLDRLMTDLASRAVVFLNRSGKVLRRSGLIDESLRFSELAVLLANNFTTTAEISTYLGDCSSTAVHYYSGNWHDIYALSVSLDYFLVVVFPSGSQKQMGPVLRFGKGAVDRLAGFIQWTEDVSTAAPETTPRTLDTGPLILKKTGPLNKMPEEPKPMGALAEARARAAAKRKEEEERVEEEVEIFAFAELQQEESAEKIELNLDDLDAGLGELDDLDNFWSGTGVDEAVAGTESLSIEEAMELGLIPKDLEE